MVVDGYKVWPSGRSQIEVWMDVNCAADGGGSVRQGHGWWQTVKRDGQKRSADPDDSQGSDDEWREEDRGTPHEEGVAQHPHTSTVPSIVVVQVQPSSAPMHRPDVAKVDALYPNPRPPSSSDTSSSRSLDTLPNSLRGSVSNLDSTHTHHTHTFADYSPCSANVASEESLAEVHVSRQREWPRLVVFSRRCGLVLSRCTEAARPPQESRQHLPPSLAYTRLGGCRKETLHWADRRLFSTMLGRDGDHQFAGQYNLGGSSTPISQRGAATVRAMADYENRIDTKNNPAWYSFGLVVVALRYLPERQELEVDIVQVTQLPPGKEHTSLDFQVRVSPGRRSQWTRGLKTGPSLSSYIFTAKCSFKVRSLCERSLVVSGFVSGGGGGAGGDQPHLTLGHGLVPNLAAQQLTPDTWCTFPVNLRHGSQVQDHLGVAQVSLSCLESSHGCYAFSADVTHVKNVKVQRLGHITNSRKTRTELWVHAVIVSGGKQKRCKISSTPLERPRSLDKQGWEAIFQHSCTISFSVPKDKAHLSCLILEVHGRVSRTVTSKEALLRKIMLGPEELFGGELMASSGQRTHPMGKDGEGRGGSATMSVPGDPLDARLTHWGQALRRKAKVEMWHRLQI
ncbi:LOW QUALITY PROTEIN: uncharacterized protein [Panulirus ornatus]|uniref:LOW QUALITY PROTEIN: uncharacterized protein n=1 Tax=Panulirus ornatus TaxID=150431 RepID=UPI003A8702B2